jgi:hypothetical protein
MKQTLLVAAALLAAMTVAGQSATTTPKPPTGYAYLADGKLVRLPGPGMIYDANDKLVPRPFACASSSSSAPVSAGGKTTVGFPCDNIYAGLVQLPA